MDETAPGIPAAPDNAVQSRRGNRRGKSSSCVVSINATPVVSNRQRPVHLAMGVVKTASESILEETVVPSEEASYSLQGHAGKRAQNFILSFMMKVGTRGPHLLGNVAKDECAFSAVSGSFEQGCCASLSFARSSARSFLRPRSRNSGCSRRGFKGDVASRPQGSETANRCLEIQIYSPRCSRAYDVYTPTPPGKSDLRRCDIFSKAK